MKAVVQATPTYMISIFKIPDGILDSIHSLMAHFWWGLSANNRKIHWHSWPSLFLPKVQGGMGFRDLKVFNQVLLAKQVWQLHEGTNPLLTAVLKARYYKNDDVLDARRGFDPSFTWRSMWGAKSLLLEGLGWRVGSGWLINAKSDKWLLTDGKFSCPVMRTENLPDIKAGELIDADSGRWNVEMLNDLFDPWSIKRILSIPVVRDGGIDRMFWGLTKSGVYSVKTGYWLGMLSTSQSGRRGDAGANQNLWKTVWNLNGPPKLKHFLWRACKNSLPVNYVRYQRHIQDTATCSRCNEETETICHATLKCKKIFNI